MAITHVLVVLVALIHEGTLTTFHDSLARTDDDVKHCIGDRHIHTNTLIECATEMWNTSSRSFVYFKENQSCVSVRTESGDRGNCPKFPPGVHTWRFDVSGELTREITPKPTTTTPTTTKRKTHKTRLPATRATVATTKGPELSPRIGGQETCTSRWGDANVPRPYCKRDGVWGPKQGPCEKNEKDELRDKRVTIFVSGVYKPRRFVGKVQQVMYSLAENVFLALPVECEVVKSLFYNWQLRKTCWLEGNEKYGELSCRRLTIPPIHNDIVSKGEIQVTKDKIELRIHGKAPLVTADMDGNIPAYFFLAKGFVYWNYKLVMKELAQFEGEPLNMALCPKKRFVVYAWYNESKGSSVGKTPYPLPRQKSSTVIYTTKKRITALGISTEGTQLFVCEPEFYTIDLDSSDKKKITAVEGDCNKIATTKDFIFLLMADLKIKVFADTPPRRHLVSTLELPLNYKYTAKWSLYPHQEDVRSTGHILT